MNKEFIFDNLQYTRYDKCSLCGLDSSCMSLNIKLDNEEHTKIVRICKSCFLSNPTQPKLF